MHRRMHDTELAAAVDDLAYQFTQSGSLFLSLFCLFLFFDRAAAPKLINNCVMPRQNSAHGPQCNRLRSSASSIQLASMRRMSRTSSRNISQSSRERCFSLISHASLRSPMVCGCCRLCVLHQACVSLAFVLF